MARKRIMVVIHSLARGGAERTVSLIASEWAGEHDVTITVFDSNHRAYPLADSIRIDDLDCAASPSIWRQLSNAVTRVGRLVSLLRREDPDVVISFMESANFAAVLACLCCGYLNRLTVSVRNDPRKFPVFYRVLIPFLYRLPNRIVTPSAGVRRALVDDFLIRDEVCVTVPNPANLDAASQAAAEPAPGDVPPTPFVLGVGRLVYQKGFDMLMEAFERSGISTDHSLVILGEGAERQRLEALAGELGIGDRVFMPGAVHFPLAFMARARLFVLSSRFEGMSNVVLEAMTCGCAVVAFDCPFGTSEVIEDERSGILVPAEDVDGLARAIERVCGDGALRSRLGDSARQRAEAFDYRTIAPRWLQVG